MKGLDACVVLVTPRSFGAKAPELRTELEAAVGDVRYSGRALKAHELRDQIADVDGMLAGLDEIDAGVFDAGRELRVVARYGAGLNNVDLAAAHAHGVVVTSTPGSNSEAVAELAIGLMFALARSIPQSDRAVHEGLWKPAYGIQLTGRTVGLLGLGRIGRAVAQRARSLGCSVMAYDPYIESSQMDVPGVAIESVQTVLESAHFLSLHLPLTQETRGMVGRSLLQRLRPECYLINTSRGEIVVEEDLIWALESGQLRGAALDTLSKEPPDPANPLLSRADVILTPHSGAHTVEAIEAMGRAAMNDLLAVLRGNPPLYPVVA